VNRFSKRRHVVTFTRSVADARRLAAALPIRHDLPRPGGAARPPRIAFLPRSGGRRCSGTCARRWTRRRPACARAAPRSSRWRCRRAREAAAVHRTIMMLTKPCVTSRGTRARRGEALVHAARRARRRCPHPGRRRGTRRRSPACDDRRRADWLGRYDALLVPSAPAGARRGSPGRETLLLHARVAARRTGDHPARRARRERAAARRAARGAGRARRRVARVAAWCEARLPFTASCKRGGRGGVVGS